MKVLIIPIALFILLAGACTSDNTVQETNTLDHGHAHDAQGGHISESDEIPTIDFTIWTNKTELFVEFPALVVGYTSRFAAHFTTLDKHKPVQEGTVTVRLISGDKETQNIVEAPARAGIFTPYLVPDVAGMYEIIFDIETSTFSDQIILDRVEVFASILEAQNALSGAVEDIGAITFLKEQAWKIEFQTVPVRKDVVYDVIRTSGIWQVAPSDINTLVASTNGAVTYKGGGLMVGSRVKKGQVLMMVSSSGFTSNNLGVEIQKAEAELVQAKAEYERKKDLNASKVVPKSELEKAEQKYLIAKSTYETLNAGYTDEGKQVVASSNGYIKSISVANGGFVQQGAELLTIISRQSSLLEVQVSPSYVFQLNNIHDISYQPIAGHWSSLKNSGGSVISIGREVKSDNPLVSVIARVGEDVEMPEGSFTEVQIAIGDPVEGIIIPETALLEDYGSYSVIVQLSGESFERRPVTIGKRNGNQVEILSGLSLGELVVTTGAYQVKMASMSGQVPAHGHTH
jgi:cobalt-zinc-cadmium efflux system membrane fusion protein